MQQRGWDVTYLPVDQDGLINLDQLKDAIREDTAIVSVMYVNNEIGAHLDCPSHGSDNSCPISLSISKFCNCA